MKTIRFLLLFILFGAALYLGYRMGFSSPAPVLPVEAKKADESLLVRPSPVLPNGQISLLLVTVDDLGAARPRLESVWLVEFLPPDPSVTLLSVYPSFSSDGAAGDTELANGFRLEQAASGLRVGQAFLQVLQGRKLFWSGTILMDRAALAQVLNYMDLPQPQQSLADQADPQGTGQPASQSASQPGLYPDSGEKVDALPSSSQNPQMALFGQASIYQEICQSASGRDPLLNEASQAELAKLLEGHYYADLDPRQVMPRLKAYLSEGAAIYCTFPTLPIQSMSSR